MKRVVYVLVLLAATAAAAACGLNPQPFPPDNPDAAGGTGDASKGNDGSFFGDAGAAPDAEEDSAPVPQTDGGGTDGDAGDASDALVDAPLDAIDDVVLDVTTD